MAKHSILYYLLREDQRKNPMPPESSMKIRKKLVKIPARVKPTRRAKPLTDRKGDAHPPRPEEKAPKNKE